MPTILVVDDEPLVLRATCRALRTAGFQALGAASVKAAIELAQQQGFDAVVSDYDLGDGTGLDVFDALDSPLRFILYSGNSDARISGRTKIRKPDMRGVELRLKEWLP